MRPQKLISKGLIAVLILMIVSVVSAREVLDEAQCHVAEDAIIEGDLFVFCGDLVIEGHVTGNVIGAANTRTVQGQIDGSIYLLGGKLIMRGGLGKDLHFIGVALRVEEGAQFDHPTGAILSINLTNTIAAGVTVPGNITDLGYQLIIDGDVGREVGFWGAALNISGRVDGDVTATVGNSKSTGTASQIETLLIPLQYDIQLVDPGLILTERGVVNGQLKYTGPTEGIIRGNAPNRIFNSTEPLPITGTPVEKSARSLENYLKARLRDFIALMFVATICIIAVPRQVQAPIRVLQARPISSLGVGMLSFIMSFPIVLLLALMSLFFMFILTHLPINDVTLFSGIVLGLANIGAASVFYFTAIYIGRVVVALALGRFIVRTLRLRRNEGRMRALFTDVTVGILLLSVLGAIPLVGKIFTAVVLFLGLGAILSVARIQIYRLRESGGFTLPSAPIQFKMKRSPRLPYYPENAAQFTSPVVDELPDGIGANNLPKGFNWWGEQD